MYSISLTWTLPYLLYVRMYSCTYLPTIVCINVFTISFEYFSHLQRQLSTLWMAENKSRLEDVRADLDQMRHWVATQVRQVVGTYTCVPTYIRMCIQYVYTFISAALSDTIFVCTYICMHVNYIGFMQTNINNMFCPYICMHVRTYLRAYVHM